ncbi:hypothetical protein DXC04_03710 [Dorea sp. OM07-5]|uniref:beta-propeller domain-containing protein n=1 Tax=Dorea sp. OM07-5 TaxID=2293100 RepID=UPI000E487191|nr:beta-propeller domain-containing protein [Dorea sp. OM07-5]RHU97475.1 hypothetical protein DXC04_03710 [Dorea sp. OM07-5]
MEKREQDLLYKIEVGSENVVVPDSLKPENMKKKLEQCAWKERRRKRRRQWKFAGAAAAGIVLVAGITVYQNRTRMVKSDSAVINSVDSSDGVVAKSVEKCPVNKRNQENQKYYAKSYKEIRKYIEASEKEETAKGSTKEQLLCADATGDYSNTNVRQEGVDEADVAKTNGRYLYVLEDDGDYVSIVDTKTNMKKISEIKAPKDETIEEFYLIEKNKKVVMICSNSSDDDYEDVEDVTRSSLISKQTEGTQVVTYDVQDKKHPKKVGKVSQSGEYESSRISDGYLYLFSNYWVPENWKKKYPSTYIPYVDGDLMKAKDIYLPEGTKGCMYEIISAIDLKHPDKIADSKAIFSEGGDAYVSNKNIYYYEEEWTGNGKQEKTLLRKLSYKKGKLAVVAQKTFRGYLNDSFSIDEYDGYLRMVVTRGRTNAVYVLDQKLKLTGKITNLAKDERVYSARFLGDTGYFVTYKETDPLFSVDLSNPKNPKILGRLKIPGFSNYLHFYGEDKLLGIGMDVDKKGDVTDGVKLSMFDISDKKNVKEEHKYTLKDVYSTDVEWDYKAALIDVEKNIIGFPAGGENRQMYYLFSYTEEKGFQCNMKEKIYGSDALSTRGIYIKDRLYVIHGNVLKAYSLKTYKKVDDCLL